jgi:hypothetical protein
MSMPDDIELTGSLHESAGQEQPDKLTPQQEVEKETVQEVVDFFSTVSSVEDAQRRQEDEDREFEGADQWLPEHRTSRNESTDAAGNKIAARPTISVNLVEGRVLQIVNEARQARLGLSVQPKAGLANTKNAGYYKGLMRSIQTDSGAGEVRIWGLEGAAICGRGNYRIDVEYNNDGDFDLDIIISRILDQSTVYWDPYSVISDRRDAERAMITDWISERERLRRWPNKPLVPTRDAFGSVDHPWFAMDGNQQKSVRIATYFKVVYRKQYLVYDPQLGTIGPMAKDDLPPQIREAMDSKQTNGLRVREVDVRTVKQYVVDGSQVLSDDTWLGRYIPIIPTIGKEKNIKGKRSWKGIVTNLKDLNRAYNVTISSAVEAAGKIPRSSYIMAAGQDEGFEEMWDDSPIKAYVRLYYNAISIDGKTPLPPPQRTNEEPAIQGTLLLARVLKDDLGSVGGMVDAASFRAVNPHDRSGRAIEALQRQGASGTSNFLDNLATISMVQEGRVLIDLIPKVYDRPGRIIGVMGEENDDETAIMLKVPFVRDGDGNPVPVPCPQCKGTGEVRTIRSFGALIPCPVCQGSKQATKDNMPPEFNGQKVEYVDLTQGQFKVSVSVGRNHQTKQEEAMSAMTELANSAPALVPIYADLWVRAMGFSGSQEIADRLKRANPNAQDPNAAKDIPPEVAAKFQQLQVQHQAAMSYIQQLQKALETDQVKAASAKELLAMKLEAASGLEHIKQQSKLMGSTEDAKLTAEIESLKASTARMMQESEQRHEVLLELLQQQHATTTAREKAAADKEAARAAAEERPAIDQQS